MYGNKTFGTARGGLSAFQRWYLTRGIQHIRARRCHPQTLGKVERVHRTIDEERERIGLGLEEYIEYYNTERPHASLMNRVPRELYWSARRIEMRETRIKKGGVPKEVVQSPTSSVIPQLTNFPHKTYIEIMAKSYISHT
ncbi:MAG: integrase core domain-containing protein [Candidatus Thorarchaeota archaeon]